MIPVSGLIPQLGGQIANALWIVPSFTTEESWRRPQGEEIEGDAIVMGISTENEEGHLLSFSTLFSLGGDFFQLLLPLPLACKLKTSQVNGTVYEV